MTNLMRQVAECTTERGPASLLHWADFHRAGIDDANTDDFLAALCRTGLALAGKRQPARISAMKGPKWTIQPLPALSRFDLALWTDRFQAAFALGKLIVAVRCDVRDVCTVPPFLEMGAGVPTVVHDAL